MTVSSGPPRDVAGYNGKPPKVVWPNGARIAISLVVNYEEGSEAAMGDGGPEGERGLGETAGSLVPPGRRDLGLDSCLVLWATGRAATGARSRTARCAR